MLIHTATRRITRKAVPCRLDAEVRAINQMNVSERSNEFGEADEVELDG